MASRGWRTYPGACKVHLREVVLILCYVSFHGFQSLQPRLFLTQRFGVESIPLGEFCPITYDIIRSRVFFLLLLPAHSMTTQDHNAKTIRIWSHKEIPEIFSSKVDATRTTI